MRTQLGITSGAVAVEGDHGMETMLEMMTQRIAMLEETLMGLEKHLDGVLTPCTPTPAVQAVVRERRPMSRHLEKLTDLTRRLECNIDHVNDLRSRFEP